MATNRRDDSSNFEEQYCDFLDEIWPVNIWGLEYQASMCLRLIDPTAYRCGLNDYADSCDDEWGCDKCGNIFDTEEEADECCAERTDEEIIEDNIE